MSDLTRVTVNLTPRAVEALEVLCARSGDSRTDVINRALRVGVVVGELVERGGGRLRVVGEDGVVVEVYFL